MIQLVSQKNSCRDWRLTRKVFADLVNTFAVEDIDFVDLSCENGHQFTDRLLRQMNSALFYLFVRNMLRDINTKIHQEVKPYSQITIRPKAKNEEKNYKITVWH